MILYETLGDRGYHTAILTTFAIDFDAFETLALNRLRGAWCRNVIAIADAGMVGLALEGLPQTLGLLVYAIRSRRRSLVALVFFTPSLFCRLDASVGG